MVTPAFIDAVFAAEMLHVPVETVLDLVREGRIRTYGGRASNPFMRSADVAALAQQLGLGRGESSEAPRRVKSASARVQARVTADSRWGDVSEDDIREWAARADRARLQAAQKAARIASDRLSALITVVDDYLK